ncbi:MAG TPA: hypothetical protein ENH02_04305 [Bacteroidetes bacterium]|nr:hypothetical protein [Bacteroidota bacterium]
MLYKIQTGSFWVYSYGKKGFDFTHSHIISFLFSYRKGLTTLVFLLMIVGQIQTYQYRTGYIHWSEMNKERYWKSFLRIDKVIRKEKKDW